LEKCGTGEPGMDAELGMDAEPKDSIEKKSIA
jgi:hypothetical protein